MAEAAWVFLVYCKVYFYSQAVLEEYYAVVGDQWVFRWGTGSLTSPSFGRKLQYLWNAKVFDKV